LGDGASEYIEKEVQDLLSCYISSNHNASNNIYLDMISQLRGVDPSSWIWPFHFLKTAFFGPMVDNKIEDGIIFIYPLCICNNLFNFNSLDYLNKSAIG
jgi:hypothetical protein